MNVEELISALGKLPPKHQIGLHWDGCARGYVDAIIVTGDGQVVIIGEWSKYDRDQYDLSRDVVVYEKRPLA